MIDRDLLEDLPCGGLDQLGQVPLDLPRQRGDNRGETAAKRSPVMHSCPPGRAKPVTVRGLFVEPAGKDS